MTTQPTGTVTFLFNDRARSPRLQARLGGTRELGSYWLNDRPEPVLGAGNA